MKSIIVNRRLMLRGAGGFTLGLPFLESLALPCRAYGQTAVPGRVRRFVAFTTEHGGIEGKNMYPESLLTDMMPVVAGHDARWGKLKRTIEGTDAALSPVLRAPAALFSDRLAGKMNVLRGFDIPFYIAHHTGGHLGNYARNDGNGGDGKLMQATPLPTIDQVMAWSPSFYPDLAGIKERSLVTGTRGGFSWNWSNPAAKNGAIQEVRGDQSSLSLFNKIFVAPAMPGANPRKPIVDRVMEGYRSLKSNRRLSTPDRQRVDDHLSRLAELQRRLNVSRPASCSAIARPTDDTNKVGYSYGDPVKSRRRFQLLNDVIVAGFMCGTTRIAVVSVADTFSSFTGDWHQDVAHKHALPEAQKTLVDALRLSFESSILDLASKLDVDEGGGATYLDNSLLQWTQESGQNTHDSPSIPVVTFGSAAGAMKTGMYVDYRNQVPGSRMTFGKLIEYAGLTYNRWLGSVLQLMGVPRAEFEKGAPGYGNPFVGSGYKSKYVAGVVESAGEIAPLLKA
jgi:hypothetical protein